MTNMKTHFAEEIDDASKHNETAAEQTWRSHRLPPASPLGNLAAIIVLLIAFVTLVQLIPRTQLQPLQADTLVIPGQPIWVLSNPPKRPTGPAAPVPAEQKSAEQTSAPKVTP
jgi:hypothetical protein